MITADQLMESVKCDQSTADIFVEPINISLKRYAINTPERIAFFLGQTGHESAGFSRLEENLNYSALGLIATWPSRFGNNSELAQSLHRNPEAIANAVYSGRMGNGDEKSGDGWRYRGRGLIQITGRSNYAACGQALGLDLLSIPETLTRPLYAALSAGWYWHKHGLNAAADDWDIVQATRTINGGTNGLPDRIERINRAYAVLTGE